MKPTIVALCLAVFVIAPWGNFAINDDWTFAHLAKQTAETNAITLNAPLAPNAVGQAIIGAAVVKLVGFSHTALRISTLLLSVMGLWAVYRLSGSKLATFMLALNPLWLYSSLSFMNDLWGWVPALFGAVLWTWRRPWRGFKSSMLVMCSASALIGASFWTRQHAILVYPALLVAAPWFSGRPRRFMVRALVTPTIAWLMPILAYFPWAMWTGNLRPEFTDRAQNLYKFSAETWALQSGAGLMYLTLFCLPWLLVARWPVSNARKGIAIALVGLAVLARILFQSFPTDNWIGPTWGHRVFPWGMNIITQGGVGPVTLDDAYFGGAQTGVLPSWLWMGLEFGLMLACGLWASLSFRRLNEAGRFAVALAGICLVAIIQSHQVEVVDRYWLPLVIAAHIALPQMVDTQKEFETWALLKFAIPATAIVLFSVFGLHDQFRWMEARESLIAVAQKQGATPATTAAGWETNCWHKFQHAPKDCEGGCRRSYNGFCALDDRFRIGVAVLHGYEAVASIKPKRWLAPGPPLVLSRRKDAPSVEVTEWR